MKRILTLGLSISLFSFLISNVFGFEPCYSTYYPDSSLHIPSIIVHGSTSTQRYEADLQLLTSTTDPMQFVVTDVKPVTPMVLAAYQAWHGLPSHSTTPYDSRDPLVISRHIQKAKEMGIDGFVVDWYGPKDEVANDNDREFIDQSTTELIKQAENQNFKVALMYDEATIPQAQLETSQYISQVQSDLSYAQKYFSSPAYLHIDCYPALFIFSYGEVDHLIDWVKVRNELETAITLIDKDPNPDDLRHDSAFDGFYAWVQADWSPSGEEWGEKYLNWFYPTMSKGIYARKVLVGGAWPGFDDLLAAWSENRYVSRKNGRIYDTTMSLAREYKAPVIMIDTWNDFEEGTDIEFGVKMTVNMENNDPEVLVRSSPVEVKWDPSRGDAVLQVYKDGNLIYEQNHSSGTLLALRSESKYELKIWVSGSSSPIAKWIKIRSQDPIPDTSPIIVE